MDAGEAAPSQPKAPPVVIDFFNEDRVRLPQPELNGLDRLHRHQACRAHNRRRCEQAHQTSQETSALNKAHVMAYQYSVAVRNAGLDARQTAIGPNAVLKAFSGAEPADCAAANPSGLLATIQLPATWMNPAANGVKTKAGVWSGVAAAGGVIASWRIYASDGVTCGAQGNTADMTFDNTNVAVNQPVTVNGFQLTAPHA